MSQKTWNNGKEADQAGQEPSSKRRKSGYTQYSRGRTAKDRLHTPNNVTSMAGRSQTATPASGVNASPIRPPRLMSIFPRDVVLARLKAKNIFRSVDVTNVYSVDEFFAACGAAWQIRVEKLYVYLPDNIDGILEVNPGSHSSFKDALKMFHRGPDNEKETVMIRVLLLAQDEHV